MIKAVIFDMDGVLLDSEECIRKACIKALEQYGIHPVEEDFIPFTGMGEDKFIGGVAEKYGLQFTMEMKRQAYAVYAELADDLVVIYDGIPEMIRELRSRGYKVAVASAADETKVNINLRCMGLTREDFDAVVTGDQVERKKPFPDIFLEAARRIGMDPALCMVCEDAVSGCQGAKAAGMYCTGVVTSTFDPALLTEAGADRLVAKTPMILSFLETHA